MAAIYVHCCGRLRFRDKAKRRIDVYLGKAKDPAHARRKFARARCAVEALLRSAVDGSPLEPEAARWLAKTSALAKGVHSKIARTGLVDGSQKFSACAVTLIVQESRRIQFTDSDGARRTIDTAWLSPKAADALLAKIETIRKVQADPDLRIDGAALASRLPKKIRTKLEGAGLIGGRGRKATRSLASFLDLYIRDRSDVKSSTRTVYGHVRRNLVDCFGERKDIAAITERDAKRFRAFLKAEEKLGINTINKRCQIAKQFFDAAVEDRLLAASPFDKLRAPAVKADRKKDRVVSRSEAFAIIKKAPDAQWRLIFALSRFGGLRCPSEHLALRWEDIDWRKKRIRVRSPKTEHILGKESRVIPMFPELEKYLREVLRESPDESTFVITRYRDAGTNLRTQLLKLIDRAGLKPWPNLFNNLRKTRENELTEQYPEHVVCEWMGNSKIVAREHYLRATDADFESAVMPGTTSGTTLQPSATADKRRQRIPRKMQKSSGNTQFPEESEEVPDGRYWTRTSDLHDVNVAL